jgi:predicted RNase H-like HicB family nuclease
VTEYTFSVEWSDEDQKFVGTCTEFPSLSHVAATREAALVGIRALVRFARADMQETGEQAR